MIQQSSIFHAFNIRYTKIRDTALHLKEIGFSHVQFPPIQTTRILTEYDSELLRNLVTACDKQLTKFSELCLNAQEKSKLYSNHSFDHVLRSQTYYINQPTLRSMHLALCNGIKLSELLEYTYNQIYNGSIVSPIAAACIDIGFTGKKHARYSILNVAEMILSGIDVNAYSDKELKNITLELSLVDSNHKMFQKELSVYMQNKNDPPLSLLTAYADNKKQFTQLHSLKQNLLKSKELYDLLQLTPSIINDIQKETYVLSSKLYDRIKFKNILKCIFFYEFILYSPWWLIYQPVNFEIGNTLLGTKEEIIEAIQTCKSHGLNVLVDIVVNNLAATPGERNDWIRIQKAGELKKSENQPIVLRLKQLLQGAFGSDDLDIVTQPHECVKGQEPTHCWMSLALPQLNQSHPFVIQAQDKFLKSLAELGVDGLRIDAAAHISPENCKRVIDIFHMYRGISHSISYIEYLGGSECWRNYKFSDYAGMLRLEDFDIGESLYLGIFSAHADLERTKNYGTTCLKRYSNLDSVVMLINHDHIMGSIPSAIYSDLPSKVTYDLSLAYLIQRVYGHVLVMPHDITSETIQTALMFRKLMREYNIIREHVDVFDSVMTSYKYDLHNKCVLISAFNLHSSSQTVLNGVLEPLSFQWIFNNETFIISDVHYYNKRSVNLLENCYIRQKLRRKRKTLKRRTRYLETNEFKT